MYIYITLLLFRKRCLHHPAARSGELDGLRRWYTSSTKTETAAWPKQSCLVCCSGGRSFSDRRPRSGCLPRAQSRNTLGSIGG